MFYSNKNGSQKQSGMMQKIVALIANKTNHEPKQYGMSYILRCPAHDDKKPSLSITEGRDGRVLLHCFCGCEVEVICASVGIKLRDLFPPKK
jgi:hypothetical protein